MLLGQEFYQLAKGESKIVKTIGLSIRGCCVPSCTTFNRSALSSEGDSRFVVRRIPEDVVINKEDSSVVVIDEWRVLFTRRGLYQ